MDYALCSAPPLLSSFKATLNSGNHLHIHQTLVGKQYDVVLRFPDARFCRVKAKAAKSDQGRKPNSVICTECDGNGAVLCSQCQGSGVNSVDFFDGRFKKGDSCWLCGGRKDILCGNCNGAGFIGGFMSTFDE